MVEYIEESHTYLVDGIIVPSVTQVLQFKFPDKYKGVPGSVLNNKAEYGTKVHKLVEILNSVDCLTAVIGVVKEFDYVIANSLEQYAKIYFNNKIKPIAQEQIVFNDNVAGRFDLLAGVNGELSLCDIKTTATLDQEYLSWQLSMYNYLGKIGAEKLYAIWLPKKDLGRLVEVEFKTNEEIENLIEEWCKCNAQENLEAQA